MKRFEDASMNFAGEPIISVERLAPVTERARAAIGDIASACVVCSLSPPEPGFKLLTPFRERAVPAELPCWPQIEHASSRLWLEFDEHSTASTMPGNWHLWLDAWLNDVELAALIDAGSSGCSSAMVATLRDCLSVLPSGGQLRRFVFLGTRRPAELRVAVSIPEQVVRQYLQQVARSWGASWDHRLSALLPWLSARLTGESALCQLSIRADGPHEMGVIYSQAQVMLGLDDQMRSSVRAQLLREGLCNLAQDAALARWMLQTERKAEYTERWVEILVSLGRHRLTSQCALGFSPVVDSTTKVAHRV